jgi:glycosyltransferase involved in cell wall biosynthesis
MKILLVNKFFYARGGAETAFFETARLLAAKGHTPSFFSMRDPRNAVAAGEAEFVTGLDFDRPASWADRLRIPGRMLYSREAARRMDRWVERIKPDLAHLHNVYHHLSPSVIDVLDRRGVPMVMTLHDYKMICPVYSMFRAGRPCEECRARRFHRCILHRCAKGSLLKSSLSALEMTLHQTIWPIYRRVDRFISPSEFLKSRLGDVIPAGRLDVWPNVLDTGSIKPAAGPGDGSIVYFGRLSAEKGLRTLLRAMPGTGAELRLFGDGPLRQELMKTAAAMPDVSIVFGGHLSQDRLWDEVRKSSASVLPSEWYENNPRCALESFALGRPVIGARIGGIPEIIRNGRTGWLFEPGNEADLRRTIIRVVRDPEKASAMGSRARAFVEDFGDAERRYPELLAIYEKTMARRRRKPRP